MLTHELQCGMGVQNHHKSITILTMLNVRERVIHESAIHMARLHQECEIHTIQRLCQQELGPRASLCCLLLNYFWSCVSLDKKDPKAFGINRCLRLVLFSGHGIVLTGSFSRPCARSHTPPAQCRRLCAKFWYRLGLIL